VRRRTAEDGADLPQVPLQPEWNDVNRRSRPHPGAATLKELRDRPGAWVVRSLEERGASVHLNSQLVSAEDGHVVLSNGTEFDSGLMVWFADSASNATVHNHTEFPVGDRGLLLVRPDLPVGTETNMVSDMWAAGDAAAVPNLAGRPETYTVPNAQPAVREGKRLAKNVLARLPGTPTTNYVHHSSGVNSTLELGR
jgi:NADH dehydrogenase